MLQTIEQYQMTETSVELTRKLSSEGVFEMCSSSNLTSGLILKLRKVKIDMQAIERLLTLGTVWRLNDGQRLVVSKGVMSSSFASFHAKGEHLPSLQSSLTISPALSAHAKTLVTMFPLGTIGMTLASHTLRFLVPYTLNRSSTTPPISFDIIAQLPHG